LKNDARWPILAGMRTTLPLALLVFLTSACSDLGPLGVDDSGDGTGGPLDVTEAVFDLTVLKRLEGPATYIDAGFLDGDVPESVGIIYEGNQAHRHRVLTDAFLRLEKEGTFVFNASFSSYIITAGFDEGPSQVCTATVRGSYERGDVTVTLSPDGSEETYQLVLDAQSDLRMLTFPVTCTRTEGLSLIEADILLEGLIFRIRG